MYQDIENNYIFIYIIIVHMFIDDKYEKFKSYFRSFMTDRKLDKYRF